MTRSFLVPFALLVQLLVLATLDASAQAAPQIEEEDLEAPPSVDRPTPGVDGAVGSTIDREELLLLHREAKATFDSEQRPASLPLFGRVLDLVETLEASQTAAIGDATDAEQLERLAREARLHRAALQLELGADAVAGEELRLLIEDDPGAATLAALVGPATAEAVATPSLEQLYASVRRGLVGTVRFVLDPVDAEVLVDDEVVVDGTGPVAAGEVPGSAPGSAPGEATVDLLAGERQLTIRRPGHEPMARLLTVEPGRRVTIEQTLERTSPVLRVATRPTGASVYLDGELLGTTEGLAEESFRTDGGDTAVFRLDQLSKPLVVDGIEPGLRILEVRSEGHRPYRAELEILEPIDYQMPPIVLEAEAGQLVFQSFPAGATIRVDGAVVEPDVPGATRPRVTLPPGEYLVTVDSGAARMDSTRLRLADGQTVDVDVELRPGLAFLGTLGGNASSDRAAQTLRRVFEESPHWTLIDRAAEGVALLRGLGVGAAAFAGQTADESIDWPAVQAALDARAPGLAYLVAVPSDDLLSPEPALWAFPAAPGPARPERLVLPADARERSDHLRQLFDRDLPLRRPYVGALVIDSDAVSHPVVASVAPSSPAERAGFRVGMQVLGVAGAPVQSADDFVERILAAETGETVEVALRGGTRPQAVRLELGNSPWAAVGEATDLPRAVTWARLVQLAERATPDEAFVVALDQALVLLRAGDAEGAVRVLRGVRAPQISHGFGQASIDYWLGVALSRVGPDYLADARSALERAARVPGARMFHHDDAWVAPRARARLRALDAGIF